MRQSFRHSPPLRLAAVCVIAFALFVKMLVAPGMMPVADAGGIRIVLCTGSGPVETVLDTGKRHGDQGKAAHDPCAFGMLGMGALADEQVGFDSPAIAPALPPAALPPLPARAPPAASLPPPTGPPILA
jgi:hypothetical protein